MNDRMIGTEPSPEKPANCCYGSCIFVQNFSSLELGDDSIYDPSSELASIIAPEKEKGY
jgi:hypothetical protein